MKKLRKFIWIGLGLQKLRYAVYGCRTAKKYPITEKGKSLNYLPCIMSCNNEILTMGGLADRLYGMVSVYKLCKELGIPFKIWHSTPFQLSNYLKPNKVDWKIDENEISLQKGNIKIMKSPMPSDSRCGMTREQSSDWHAKYLKRKFMKAIRKGKQVHLYTNSHIARREEFSQLFNELFVADDKLKSLVDWNKKQIGGPYISVTIRFQNLLGDFYEGSFPTFEEENEKQKYIDKCIGKIEEIHSKHENMKVLVTSDSRKFLDAADKLPYVYTIPGKLIHMQYTRTDSYDDYVKNFVDLLMLSDAQKLYHLITGVMYGGGFSITAAYITNRPHEYIRF